MLRGFPTDMAHVSVGGSLYHLMKTISLFHRHRQGQRQIPMFRLDLSSQFLRRYPVESRVGDILDAVILFLSR